MKFQEWFEQHAPPFMVKAFASDLEVGSIARQLFDLGRLYEQHFPQGPGPSKVHRFTVKPRHLRVVK